MATQTRTRVRDRVSPGMAAWGIHLLTASGVLCGLMGLLFILDDSPKAALVWLIMAFVIDGIDGPVARRVDCRLHVPNVDGNILDLVIDYVTCVVAPAVFLDRFHMVPHGFSLFSAGLIMVTSLYAFSRTDLMTSDHYFRGWPAMWSLAINVMYVVHSKPYVNLFVVVLLCLFTCIDVKVPHPVRVQHLRQITLPILAIWLGVMLYLTVVSPRAPLWARGIELGGVAYFVWLSVRRTMRAIPDPVLVPA
jgi:phosphatidylcholine synthase